MNRHTPSEIALALLLCLPISAAQKKTAQTMELMDPATSVALRCEQEIRVRINGKTPPSKVYASLGGSPALQLTRLGDSDEWGARSDF